MKDRMVDVNGTMVELYTDCVIENHDGVKRVGRIEIKNGVPANVFSLASYQKRKELVGWRFCDIAKVTPCY